jgi:hypothetical protein
MTSRSTSFHPGSRNRLTSHDLGRFPSNRLFDRIARAVCVAGCLPRKELYEAWEVARRARRLFRGGRVIDLGGGHGLLAHLMLLLDDSSASALVVDRAQPASAARLQAALVEAWPRLEGRVAYLTGGPDDAAVAPGDVVVSCHGCGAFTDEVLAAAVRGRARVAVLPCCHDVETCDTGGLGGWMDAPMAIDAARAIRLGAQGYRVVTQTIPKGITPKNRLLLGVPGGGTMKGREGP